MTSPIRFSDLPSTESGRDWRAALRESLWGEQGRWQVRLRWSVPPMMVAGALLGTAIGFQLHLPATLLIAAATLCYNVAFAAAFRRAPTLSTEAERDRRLTLGQTIADYGAIFLLVTFTGGATSPLIVFFLLHVLLTGIHFPPRVALALAGAASLGLWLLLAAQLTGLLASHRLAFRGVPLHPLEPGPAAATFLASSSAILFLAAWMVGRVMQRLRQSLDRLAAASSETEEAHRRLASLSAMLRTLGSERQLSQVLDLVAHQLAHVLGVPAVSVQLLDADARELEFAAAHGLADATIGRRVTLEESPTARRVIDDRETVQVRVDQPGSPRLSQRLAQQGFHSAVLAPLEVHDRVLGALGFFSRGVVDLGPADRDFFRWAGALVAIAIDHARAWERTRAAMQDRTRFMLRVAHDLRAPLTVCLGMVDVLRTGSVGPVSDKQSEILDRLDRRLRDLDTSVADVLVLAETRDRTREIADVVVDPAELARFTEETFRDVARSAGLTLELHVEPGLPEIETGEGALERVMENLVSNAIKYTPSGGVVEVRWESGGPGLVRIVVRDSGIGVPESERPRLFEEFFRASNAKARTRAGTGLGLVLVRQTVERQSGEMSFTSREGEGTEVVLTLPVRPEPDRAAPSPDASE